MSPLKSFKLFQLADLIGAELDGNPDHEISGLSSLQSSGSKDISFISRDSFIPQLKTTKAGAVICNKQVAKDFNGNKLIGEDPYLLYAKCSALFKDKASSDIGISKLASISSSSIVSSNATISNFVTICDDVIIEDEVILMPGVFIGKGSKIGKGTIVYSNVSIYDQVEVGRNSIIHAGVVIGSDGLGFAKENNKWKKIEHLGKVILGEEVELGSNTTIDRGSVDNTVIGDNVKIDNQVHIAHNVKVGSGTAIAANSAIAGSTIVGKNCTMAGCSAIVDNVEITDEVHITANSLITKSIKESGIYSSGTPFMKNSEWRKNAVAFKKLSELAKK